MKNVNFVICNQDQDYKKQRVHTFLAKISPKQECKFQFFILSSSSDKNNAWKFTITSIMPKIFLEYQRDKKI